MAHTQAQITEAEKQIEYAKKSTDEMIRHFYRLMGDQYFKNPFWRNPVAEKNTAEALRQVLDNHFYDDVMDAKHILQEENRREYKLFVEDNRTY